MILSVRTFDCSHMGHSKRLVVCGPGQRTKKKEKRRRLKKKMGRGKD